MNCRRTDKMVCIFVAIWSGRPSICSKVMLVFCLMLLYTYHACNDLSVIIWCWSYSVLYHMYCNSELVMYAMQGFILCFIFAAQFTTALLDLMELLRRLPYPNRPDHINSNCMYKVVLQGGISKFPIIFSV